MRRTRAAMLALSAAAVVAAGLVGWRMTMGRGRTTATPTATLTTTLTPTTTSNANATATATAEHHPAAREAALLRAADGSAVTTTSGPPHAPGSPAAREAALLRSLAEPAAAGPPPAPASIVPLAIRPQIAPRFSAETRSAADAAAEVRAAFEARGRAAATWPPLDESDPPPGPRLNHAQRPARKVARARPAPTVEVPDRLNQWGE